MPLHLISAKRLGARLARGLVSPKEQAVYLAASFILWAAPVYLFIVPVPNLGAWSVPYALWWYEAFLMVLINIAGVIYCLGRCRVDPKANFLVDFSCLYAPVSLTTIVVGWALFYAYAWAVPLWVINRIYDSPTRWIEFAYSARAVDLVRFAAVIGISFAALVRVGRHMDRVSWLRLAARVGPLDDVPEATRT